MLSSYLVPLSPSCCADCCEICFYFTCFCSKNGCGYIGSDIYTEKKEEYTVVLKVKSYYCINPRCCAYILCIAFAKHKEGNKKPCSHFKRIYNFRVSSKETVFLFSKYSFDLRINSIIVKEDPPPY